MWRRELPHVLAALTRRYGHFDDCEDATQQALMAAADRWPADGLPTDPRGWLLRVASRRMIDQQRQEMSRRAREERAAQLDVRPDPDPTTGATTDVDDTLALMILCCHPSLTRASQVALALRAVGGLTTRQIADGFAVPEATTAQRISRAKATLTREGVRFRPPPVAELPGRVLAVRHAVSMMFTQGHLRTEGADATDSALRETAIGLARTLVTALPGDPDNAGLLALLLLTEARSGARLDAAGDLVPLEDQDRSAWDRGLVAEGVALLEDALPRGYVGPFQVQAAIAAVHAEAPSAEQTDWEQIVVLYRMLDEIAPSAAASIGLATATAEVDGPAAGLAVLDDVTDPRNHRAHAVRGHLLLRLGDRDGALASFEAAARLTRSIPEQRYLNRCIAEVGSPG
ncbi:UNVERIFIED_CONTAM: hypothetical protein LK11_58445 [Mumia flava]